MKKLFLFAVLAATLTSCTKQRDYLCTLDQQEPEGVTFRTHAVVPFTGSHAQMIAFEAARTWGTPPAGSWGTCVCK